VWPKQDLLVLQRAYDDLPVQDDEKVRFLAVLLRIRLEAVVLSVAATVLAVNAYPTRVRHKLLVAVGEMGLSDRDRVRRLEVVRRGASTYEALCDLLHARGTVLHPPVEDVAVWQSNVKALEEEFGIGVSVPTLEDGP